MFIYIYTYLKWILFIYIYRYMSNDFILYIYIYTYILIEWSIFISWLNMIYIYIFFIERYIYIYIFYLMMYTYVIVYDTITWLCVLEVYAMCMSMYSVVLPIAVHFDSFSYHTKVGPCNDQRHAAAWSAEWLESSEDQPFMLDVRRTETNCWGNTEQTQGLEFCFCNCILYT